MICTDATKNVTGRAVSEIVLSMRAKKSIAIEAAKKILEFGVA